MVAVLAACDGKKEVAPPVEPAVVRDTVETVADTLEPETEEVAPPKSADELFDDFIYGFMTNRRFQKSRVQFPLPFDAGGHRRMLTAAEWRFNPLFAEHETYTVIFSREEDMQMPKSTAVDSVVLEWCELSRGRVRSYFFERGQAGWMLMAVGETPLAANENGDFLAFYQRFATDSLYQRSHVADPVEFRTYDSETFEEISGVVDVDQWFAFRPDLPRDVITNLRYGQPYAGSDCRIVVINGLSSSLSCNLTFKRWGTTWRLVAFQN